MAAEELASCVAGGITAAGSTSAVGLIVVTGLIGIAFSLFLLSTVAKVKLDVTSVAGAARTKDSAEQNSKLNELYGAISLGASSFLNSEYKLCALFVVVIFPAMSALISWGAKEDADLSLIHI